MELSTRPQPDQQTIEAWVVRAQKGDAEAFAELIRRYERMALSVAFAVVGDGDAAGDVVQEAFLRAWQRLADLKDPGSFASWLCGIARNLAMDHHRRGRFVRGSIDAPGAGAAMLVDEGALANPLAELDRREQRQRVADAIASLDDVTRPIVVMRYFDNRSSKEIGETMKLSPAAVDMRLSRARQELKRRLSPAEAGVRRA